MSAIRANVGVRGDRVPAIGAGYFAWGGRTTYFVVGVYHASSHADWTSGIASPSQKVVMAARLIQTYLIHIGSWTLLETSKVELCPAPTDLHVAAAPSAHPLRMARMPSGQSRGCLDRNRHNV